MKLKEWYGKNKKKVTIISVSLAAVLVIVGGAAVYYVRRNGAEGTFSLQGDISISGIHTGEGMVSASGITGVGMTQVSFEVENLETVLVIEEVYVSSGESIEEGTRVLKLSQESVEEARQELETALRKSELAYRAGAIEYEQSKITAEHDRAASVLEGEQALEVYEDTVSGLEADVEKAENALAESREEIAEYQAALEGDGYYEDYKVEAYKELYDENLKLLKYYMEQWGVSWQQVTGGSDANVAASGGNPAQGETVSQGDSAAQTGNYSYGGILKNLYSVLEQNLKDYEQALSDYEDASANGQFALQTLELGLSSLEKALAQAKESYETRILEAKLTCQTSLANAERAEQDYEAALKQAESDYEGLKSAWEDAQENLELFESSVGDGYFYASGGGEILRVMVRAEQELTSGGTIFMYSDPEEMTVTVSVSQSDIAKVTLGDLAYVESSDYGSFQGVVTQIDPVAASDSRTSVTYNVTVSLSGDTGGLDANQTVQVLLGTGGIADE